MKKVLGILAVLFLAGSMQGQQKPVQPATRTAIGVISLGAVCPASLTEGGRVVEDGTVMADLPPDSDAGMTAKSLACKDGKITGLDLTFDAAASSFDRQFAFLTRKYGQPLRHDVIKKQNGFGATQLEQVAWWQLKNGDSIIAYDSLTNLPDGMAPYVQVLFEWKHKVELPGTKSPY